MVLIISPCNIHCLQPIFYQESYICSKITFLNCKYHFLAVLICLLLLNVLAKFEIVLNVFQLIVILTQILRKKLNLITM